MKQESERSAFHGWWDGRADSVCGILSEDGEPAARNEKIAFDAWQASAARFEAVVGAVSRMFDGLSTSIITIEDDSEFHANLEDLRHALAQLEAK